MIDTLVNLLKEESAVDAYEIVASHTSSAQLFYVLNKLETNRYANNDDLSATIYVKHGDKLGTSSIVINKADDTASIKAKIKDAVNTAKQVDNEVFELEKDIDGTFQMIESIKEKDLSVIAQKVAQAIMKADVHKEGWLNSIEVFANKRKTRVLNSYGVDRSFEKTTIEAEVIPTWKGEKEEIELYLHFEIMSEDYEKITQKVEAILREAYYRSKATKPQNIKADVVLSGEMRDLIFSTLASDLSFGSKYMHLNHYELSDEVVPYDLDLSVKGVIKNASHSAPFDSHGTIIKDTKIISKGKVLQNWGDLRYGQYLKADHISGGANLVEVSVNDKGDALKLPYLEIVNFSSPQLEENSGYCGGEVRLGLLHKEDGDIEPLTSFSISCNIYEALKSAEYSLEEETDESYSGPKYLRLKGVKIA